MNRIVLDPVPFEKGRCAQRGAASELRAAAYLMDAGYYVYRCVAASAPFDLVAYKDGQCLRVEVKTLTIDPHRSRPHWTPCPVWSTPGNDEWDLLALANDEHVFIFPYGLSRSEMSNEIRQALGLPASLDPVTAGKMSGRREAVA